jgi:large subunit ribosomal protein L13
MKTFSAKAEELERKWYVIDAEGKILGDVAVAAAKLLRGKSKPIFTPHVDCGDHVIVINAEKVVLSGNKEDQKVYTSYSGYVGGQKRETVRKVRERRPELIVERAVHGMIPHNRLGSQIMKKLKVCVGPDHKHEAQAPEPYEL